MSKWAEQWDSPLRWTVRSQSSSAMYLVDLGEWRCQCTRASCLEQHTKWMLGASRLLWENQCFHKVTALREFTEEVVKPAIQHLPILKEFLKPEFEGHLDSLALAFVDYLNEKERETAKSDPDGKAELAESDAQHRRTKACWSW